MVAFPSLMKFPLGRIVATPGVLGTVSNQDIVRSLGRHQSGDWGDVCPPDREANDGSLTEAGRLFSVYHTTSGVKFWIITEWDRSVTTVLLPEDY